MLRRVQRRISLNQIESLADYAHFLRRTSAEVPALSDDLMIHVTGFFRDPEAWEALREQAIAPLMAERAEGSSVRCWVTACSSGEEAYSLSMLLVEAAEAAGKSFDIKVFATDTADRTLAKARAGAFRSITRSPSRQSRPGPTRPTLKAPPDCGEYRAAYMTKSAEWRQASRS